MDITGLQQLKDKLLEIIAMIDWILETPNEFGLTPKQELFCQLWTRLTDTYANGTKSYALAFGYDLENADREDAEWDEEHKKILVPSTYDRMVNVCAASASRLLRDVKILDRVTKLRANYLEEDLIFDSKLIDIVQNGSNTDALNAIKHRNELKQRITKKLDMMSGGERINNYAGLTTEELRKLAQR